MTLPVPNLGRGEVPAYAEAEAETHESARHRRAQADGRELRQSAALRPRLGFLGLGWIGRHRMQALQAAQLAEVAAIADPDPQSLQAAASLAGHARLCGDLEELLALPLDGVVIATPSALHASQAIAVLQRGLAVFCQKPLARSAGEARQVIEAAKRADCLLGVDLSYRHTEAMQCIRSLVEDGELGRLYTADLMFHNAYGPDKPWFYERASAGGGCLMDLGIHLVDLALWTLGCSDIGRVAGRLFCRGEALGKDGSLVEDYATLELDLANGASVRIACSWNLPAGRDAIVEVSLFGTRGGAAMRNVNGSFYDFVAERYRGTRAERIASPPDAWGGRALIEWTRKLTSGARFDAAVSDQIRVHEVLDAVYAGGGQGAP